VVPAIPEEIFTIGSFTFTKPLVIMLLFALLMAAASISMIRDKKTVMDKDVVLEQQFNYPLIMLEGMLVGALTGLVGAGGGFLIIPALVILSKLPMKQAVGTSLLIIAMKSLFGFLGDMSHTVMDWKLLLSVTALAIIGLFIGNSFNRKINPNSLKKGFGWFVLVMGIYIIIKELFFK
jgi:uncharacterized membrane protein YfcA